MGQRKYTYTYIVKCHRTKVDAPFFVMLIYTVIASGAVTSTTTLLKAWKMKLSGYGAVSNIGLVCGAGLVPSKIRVFFFYGKDTQYTVVRSEALRFFSFISPCKRKRWFEILQDTRRPALKLRKTLSTLLSAHKWGAKCSVTLLKVVATASSVPCTVRTSTL